MLGGKIGVLSLGDGAAEYIKDAGILVGTGNPFKFEVKLKAILLRKFRNVFDAQEIEIAEHGRPDSSQFGKLFHEARVAPQNIFDNRTFLSCNIFWSSVS